MIIAPPAHLDSLKFTRLRPLLLESLLGLALLGACGTGDSDLVPVSPQPRSTPTAVVVVQVFTPPPVESLPSPIPLGELGAGQHISARGNYIDTETLAAGPMYCHIERDSPAFKRLVTYAGPGILFSGSEEPPFDDEDRLMHPSVIRPLSRLAELAAAEWGGEASLMVTEAYDSHMDHDLAQRRPELKYSLHFEGRSLDVIPWPPDSSRVGRLCALAHAAGFDWVHNEGDHCHASVEAVTLCPNP